MIQNILVICIGNICRSPMAEALLAHKLKTNFPTVHVSSAGLGALVGKPADPMAIALMQAQHIDMTAHRARQASPEILFASELILTMSTEQQQDIEQQYPSTRGRVHRLGKWSGYDIPDPYKRPQSAFEQALILIEQGVDEWRRKLWN